MISERTWKTLHGERPDLIKQIGSAAYLLFSWLAYRELETVQQDEDGELKTYWQAAFSASDFLVVGDQLQASLYSLKAHGWIYSYDDFDLDDIRVNLGLIERGSIWCIEETINRRAMLPTRLVVAESDIEAAPAAPPRANSSRLSALKGAIETQKSATDKRQAAQKLKREVRRQGRAEQPAPAPVKAARPLNKLDLYRRYESLFESIFSTTPPALFTNGKPNAQAARFNVIVNEYGLDEAFWMVEYALENWKELSEILRKTEPPVPGIIVNLRHTLHFWHEKCEDPVHGMREQLKSHKSEAKRDSLTRSEWSQTDEDPGDRLW